MQRHELVLYTHRRGGRCCGGRTWRSSSARCTWRAAPSTPTARGEAQFLFRVQGWSFSEFHVHTLIWQIYVCCAVLCCLPGQFQLMDSARPLGESRAQGVYGFCVALRRTLIVTEQCLLSPTRNPNLDRAGIEHLLKVRPLSV